MVLREARLSRKMSQEELAAKLGVARSTVASWELGISFPRIDKVKKLAALFGCSVAEIMENWKEVDESG